MMKISAIICTYNRCESLKDVLESLLAQEAEGIDREIIIVDNNSKDKTKETVASFQPKFNGRLKYFFEQDQGLSYARNRGVKESGGDIIAFTDDDVVVPQDWLKNLGMSFIQQGADCVFGKILPIWPVAKLPTWLERDRRLWINLALLDYGDTLKVITSPKEQFFGANFALRKDAFLAAGGQFNVDLGRKGAGLYSGEETEIFLKLLDMGKKIVYNPACFVYHRISVDRLTKEYFKRWHYDSGRSFANMYTIDPKRRRRAIFNIPLWYVKEFIGHVLKMMRFALMFNSKDAFRMQLICLYDCGAMAGFLKKRPNA